MKFEQPRPRMSCVEDIKMGLFGRRLVNSNSSAYNCSNSPGKTDKNNEFNLSGIEDVGDGIEEESVSN